MLVAGIFQDRHRHFEKFCVCIRILPKFATSVTQEKFRVFFVRQAVSGNMLRLRARLFSPESRAIDQRFDLANQTSDRR